MPERAEHRRRRANPKAGSPFVTWLVMTNDSFRGTGSPSRTDGAVPADGTTVTPRIIPAMPAPAS
jgi:hypothetical protein